MSPDAAAESVSRMIDRLSTLVIVAGHAVFLGGDPQDERAWVLQPFQAGEPPFYIEHVRAGVAIAAVDPDALLVFSGGQTRREAGPVSEADGYLRIAEHFDWWREGGVARRAATEEFARDSFENLLFGICRFREHVGRYPETAHVVSWAFKAARFDRHREAIRWPAARFVFHGVNRPVDLAGAEQGEARAIAAFARDPYGTDSADLAGKRAGRDPFGRVAPYRKTCPEVADLLRHAGPGPFTGRLPWD